jgi:hypothetical protein
LHYCDWNNANANAHAHAHAQQSSRLLGNLPPCLPCRLLPLFYACACACLLAPAY